MSTDPLYLFDIAYPDAPRWITGDQYLRKIIRKLLEPIRGRGPGGLAKVTKNLMLGLDKLGVPYRLCKKPTSVPPGQLVGLLHGPLDLCRVVAKQNACIVGPGILNSPIEWQDLFTEYQAVYNIQNCEWAADMYRPLYGERVKIWTMGVDEECYAPSASDKKIYDFLIYDLIRWRDTPAYKDLLQTCQTELHRAGCSTRYIRYGQYPRGKENAYHELLSECKALLYLSENETQGFAYNEALSMNVPILAWNFGTWCDPVRFNFGLDGIAATSIPYWDERCGVDFRDASEFADKLSMFLAKQKAGEFAPRQYVLENLRLEQGAKHYLELIEEAKQALGQA